jgi:hypothetical protein
MTVGWLDPPCELILPSVISNANTPGETFMNLVETNKTGYE